MRITPRASSRMDRQRSLFEASGLRLAQAIDAATAAGICVYWVDEPQALALWRKAEMAPAATILPPGRVLAVIASGAPLSLLYLSLNRGCLGRASIENPQPLLCMARAIDAVLRDIRGAHPDRPEYVAYYHIRGMLHRTYGAHDDFERPSYAGKVWTGERMMG